MKTLVIGLGNPVLTDDGVGIRVAEAVQALLPADTDVDVSEVSVGGLRLMEAMLGYERVILVDAFLRRDGVPGTVHRLTLEDLESCTPTQHSLSPHDTTLPMALTIGNAVGLAVPETIVIFGIDVEDINEFGDTPTPAVRASIPHAAQAVLVELNLKPVAVPAALA
jgi:hydrogenase maturation protease